MGRGVLFLLIFSLIFSIFISGILIADEDDELKCLFCGDSCVTSDEAAVIFCLPPTNGEPICGVENGECVVLGFEEFDFDDEGAEELDNNAGITPDSAFYFVDVFFDRFGNDLKNREEKILEIKAMIEKGNIEAAREALERYKKHADDFEHEVLPEQEEEAEKSSKAIRRVIRGIAQEIPEGEKDDFVRLIVQKEKNIEKAAEIAAKIKELCETLSGLDPLQYSRMCKTDDDAPEWQKKLDKDLTKEQEKIAREFVGIMKECFKTSGKDCRCEDIPFTDFSNACSEAAPLATACDIGGDERACEKLDNLEMPELPDWLQEIWEKLEEGMIEAQYDMHMPRECVEAEATTPRECGKIMIETNAPEECKQPLLDSGCDSERECREICDKIMMEIHAPECVEQGIIDPRECTKFMMPPECREKNLSPGECRDFMDNMRGDGSMGSMGPRIDFNCREIQNPEERLECYDGATSQVDSYQGGFDDENYVGPCFTHKDWEAKKQECRNLYGENAGDKPVYGDSGEGYECVIDAKCIDFSQGKLDFEEVKQREQECANMCSSQNKAWDFSYGECKCFGGDYEGPTGGNYEGGVSCDDCASQCEDIPGQMLSGTGCGPNGCECYYEDEVSTESSTKTQTEPTTTEEITITEPTTEETIETQTEPTITETKNSGAGITGGVIGVNVDFFSNNKFLKYFFG